MEASRPVTCCLRRSITIRSTRPHSLSYSSRRPCGRRKHLGAPTSIRPLSTSPPRPQEQSASPPSASPSLQRFQASTAPRSSQWSDLFQRQRPTTPTSTADLAALGSKLNKSMNMLDLVDPPSARKRPSRSSSSYRSGMDAEIVRNIEEVDAKNTLDALKAVHLRLSPMLGRTLAVDAPSGFDLQSAFRTLETRCSQNSVKSDMIAQRHHVRRGQAKKLLRSKRWRALFKEGFLHEVGAH